MSPPAREKFQIGWICALPVEVAAAKEMLDENFGILDEQDSTDTNSYTLGRVGKHYVAIAGLGQYGITPATAVAINMMRTFSQSMRIGLMVGIAAGIPSLNHDIRLGDIVISYPDGTCGGVVQYDLGKTAGDGKLVRTGALNTPPRSLLTAVANMRAATLTDDPKFPGFVDKAMRRTKRTQKTFGRPDSSTDRLFLVDREHPPSASTCEGCRPEWEQQRQAREDDEAQIHYGIVASGNTVMKHAATRERLSRETGALCVEMEAAGLMMDFPCIIVRGICDYADSHKNKDWQGYAALAAAAYAKELLGYVPTDDIVDELGKLNNGIESAFQQRESHHRENTRRSDEEDLERCHQAFKTSTYEQYKNINPNRAEGTCRWVLDNAHYPQWRDSSHNDLLWISADPGCGKSVLAKSLVDLDLDTSGSVSICYFFFKDNADQDNLVTALCALLHQLFGIQPELLRHALKDWRSNGAKIQKETEILWRILEAAVSDEKFTSTICILDALDECQEEDQVKLIDKLADFYTRSHSAVRRNWLKFLVTSRPYLEIQEGFHPATRSFPHIHIQGEEENEQIHEEINLIVKIRVEELGQSIGLSLELRKRLEQQLLQMEHRTYLWLHLALDDIRNMFRYSLQPEQEIIQVIPDSVDAAYDKILSRVPQNKRALVRTILRIVVGARRPLTTEELAIALGVAMSTNWRSAASAGLRSEGLDERIRQLCGLFVFISSSKRVYLIHQTARQFLIHNIAPDGLEWPSNVEATHMYDDLEDKPPQEVSTINTRKWYHTTRAQANFVMLKVCLAYLSADDLDNGRLAVKRNDQNMRLMHLEGWSGQLLGYMTRYPFFEYSISEWRTHASAIYPANTKKLRELIVNLAIAPTLRDYWLLDMSHLGLFKAIKLLVENGANIEAKDCQGHTPLWIAILTNETSAEASLCTKQKTIRARNSVEKESAAPALNSAQEAMVRLLVQLGADIDARDILGNTPLNRAVNLRQEAMMKLLIQSGADIEARDRCGNTPLNTAVPFRRKAMVELLIDSGADTEARDSFGNTPLIAAVVFELEAIVKLLIDSGADVNARTSSGVTALAQAAQQEHEAVVRLLVGAGAK